MNVDDDEVTKQEELKRLDEAIGEHLETAEDREHAEEEQDEVGEIMEASSEMRSKTSRGSARSKLSSRTYVTKLERQLNEEKEARLRLERELEEIKRMNQEITSRMKSSQGSKF